MEEFKIPTEIIKLPSNGLTYSKESLLHKGEIEMRYMTAKDEDILTNKSYMEKGIVIDKLLQSLIVTKIDFNELLSGDKDAILIAARILGYGKDYEFDYIHPVTNEKEKGKIDLTTLADKPLSIKNEENKFDFTLPKSQVNITFKLLTHGDENRISEEIKGLKKMNPNGSYDSSTRLKYIITSVNGKSEIKDIREFVDKHLLAPDARALRNYYAEIQPGVEMKYYLEDIEESINVPIGLNFFWPDFKI